MTRLLIALLLLLTPYFSIGQELYSRAKIFLDETHTLNGLAKLGLAVDHGQHKRGAFFTSDFSERELKLAKDAGYKVEVIIEDVQKHYQEQNKKKAKKGTAGRCETVKDPSIPSHFRLGSYAGGYYSYTELLNILDSMRLLYPTLISAKQPIDTFRTIEGREIYWVRISANPDVEDTSKPQMLTTALHHAREPGSLSATIFYMWHLLENYASDPRIKTIIDNTELYFVPCVNPDGYIYNITTSPGGGGLWRKNRRANPDGTYGVDLNRNYGLTWGYDDFGSSPITSSETYRGTSAFSEPETRAIKWLSETHKFRFGMNFHSFNDALIYPWGHVFSLLTPDSSAFSAFGSFITTDNNYRFGTCDQTLSYISNGGSDDWMYGDESSKPKIYAFTPEVGDEELGFYPPTTRIIPDCKANLQANINTASLLLPFANVKTYEDRILLSNNGHLNYAIQRLGLMNGATYSVTCTSLDSRLTILGGTKTYSTLSMLQTVQDSFAYTVAAGTPNRQQLQYVLNCNNGYYNMSDTITLVYGKYNLEAKPNAETLTEWTSFDWSVCSDRFRTPPNSLRSSSTCDKYTEDLTASLYWNTPIDLTNAQEAWLRFYTSWGIESKYDYVAVYAAPIGTGAWSPLCGRFTKEGTMSQLYNEPIYDAQRPEWVMEHMDLNDFLGMKVELKFELVSDGAANYEGFYIDDISVRAVIDSPTTATQPDLIGTNFSLYPNPATDFIIVEIKKPMHYAHLQVVDMTGRLINTLEISDKSTTIMQLKNLVNGVYQVSIVENGVKKETQRLVIAK